MFCSGVKLTGLSCVSCIGKPKEGAIIAENDGEVIFGKEIRGKMKHLPPLDRRRRSYEPKQRWSKPRRFRIWLGSPVFNESLMILALTFRS